jgi:hypothetical protein
VTVEPGESFERAVQRAGVGPAEARLAAAVLGRSFDLNALPADLSFDASVAAGKDGGEAKLLGLTMRQAPPAR